MSRRNSREAKATRRNKKALRVSPPGYIDLIQYIKDRVNVSTGTARAVIMAGTLRIDSHILGVEHTKQGDVFKRYIPADLRSRIEIHVPDVVKAEDAT